MALSSLPPATGSSPSAVRNSARCSRCCCCHLNEVVTTERLIEELWGDAAPTTAVKSVQIYVSSLRKALRAAGADDAALVTRSVAATPFVSSRSALDACSFERALAEAIKTLADGEAARAAATLREASSLWRGAPLVDFSYEPFAQAEIARLNELQARRARDAHRGRPAARSPRRSDRRAGAAVTAHPERERLAGQLMIALYRCGRQAEALDVYQRTRTAIDERRAEPGSSRRCRPTSWRRRSKFRSHRRRPSRRRAVVPPSRRRRRRPIGREEELQSAAGARRRARLVTVVGPAASARPASRSSSAARRPAATSCRSRPWPRPSTWR